MVLREQIAGSYSGRCLSFLGNTPHLSATRRGLALRASGRVAQEGGYPECLPARLQSSYYCSQLKLAISWYGQRISFALRSECRCVLSSMKASHV